MWKVSQQSDHSDHLTAIRDRPVRPAASAVSARSISDVSQHVFKKPCRTFSPVKTEQTSRELELVSVPLHHRHQITALNSNSISHDAEAPIIGTRGVGVIII